MNTHTHIHRREGRRRRETHEREKEGGREEGTEREKKRESLLCSHTHFLVRVVCLTTYTVVSAAIFGKT